MLIIAGHHEVEEPERDRYVEAFRDLVGRAREAEGCIDVTITADSLDPRRVNNLEIWESAEALDAWREVADPPQTGIEISNLKVMKYTASDQRDPFA